MPQTSKKRKGKKRSRTYPLDQSTLKAFVNRAESKYPHTSFRYDITTGRFTPNGYWPREHANFFKDTEFAEFNGLKTPTKYAWPPFSEAQLNRINGVVPQPVKPQPFPPKQPIKPEPSGSSWPLPGASAANPFAQAKALPTPPKSSKPVALIMPQRGRGGKRRSKGRSTPRSRRWRISNPALRPRRLPFKQVVPVTLGAGYFDHVFRISNLIPELLSVYEEVRISSLSIVFLTRDISVSAGLYTAILLDQDGYGNPLKSTSTWFARVADMPGSVVHHAVRGFKLNWVTTEPDSRNYVKVIDSTDIAKAIARLYIVGQDNTLSISGVLLVRGHCLCRGQYYDATKLTVAMMKDLRIKELSEEDQDAIPEDGSGVSYDHLSDQS